MLRGFVTTACRWLHDWSRALACDRVPGPDAAFDPAEPTPASSRAPYRVYNIGNNSPVQLADYIELIEECLGRKAIRNLLPLQPGDVPDTCADVEELSRDTGYAPVTPVNVGVRRFIDWYLEFYDSGRFHASLPPASRRGDVAASAG